MDGKKSRTAMLEFLDYVAQKGLIPRNTASARKASASKVLRVLDENEAQDVTTINLDEVMNRFSNLHGKGYTPESLNTYKSRVKSSLDDFASYVANPLGFKPNVQTRERKASTDKPTTSNGLRSLQSSTQDVSQQHSTMVTGPMLNSILPIPIRPDLTVHIQGLPYDLTEAEANKIASVVKAMAIAT